MLYLGNSWSLLWLAIILWMVGFVLGSIAIAIRAERTGASVASVVLSGSGTGLVLFGVWLFSYGWIVTIIGFGIILMGLLPAGLAYGVMDPTGIGGIVRNAGAISIAVIFGLTGLGMLNSGEMPVQGIGLALCLVTVGLLTLAFRPAPKRLAT
jgi:hypothetical protein